MIANTLLKLKRVCDVGGHEMSIIEVVVGPVRTVQGGADETTPPTSLGTKVVARGPN